MEKKLLWSVVGFVLLVTAAIGFAKVSGSIGISSIPAAEYCETVYPGDSVVKQLRLEVNETGWYHVVATGLLVHPQEFDVYLEADEPVYRTVVIDTPVNVTDDYFTVLFTLQDENGNIISQTSYCLHVTRMPTAATTEGAFSFGAGEYTEEDGYIVIPLYIENTGTTPVTVTLDADYSNVIFTRTTVTVYEGRETTVYAKIPTSEEIPSKITFHAISGNVRKDVTVTITEDTVTPEVEMELPNTIVVKEETQFVPIRITNYGGTVVEGKIVGKDMPFGVSLYAESVRVKPGQTTLVNAILTARNVLIEGQYVSRVCLTTPTGEEIKCKYVVVELPGVEKKSVEVEDKGYEKVVVFEIVNGPKEYRNVYVDVKVPAGWLAQAEPETFDLMPNQTARVTVTLKPGKNAEEGTAYIYIKSPDGTVIAKKSIPLTTSALTGMAIAGASPAWVIVIVIVAAVLFALFTRKGGKAAEFEEIKSEITKK